MLSDNTFSGFTIVPPRAREMDSSMRTDHEIIYSFAALLTQAACEWFLIFLMFLDAILSYLLVWFARYCRLQLPCFLCSKLHHRFHWRLLLCRRHRSEVSCFVSCQIHDDNLADSRGMCDDCLLSFTKKTGPNPDMHRLLLGKLGYDLLQKSDSVHPRSCSCCEKPWTSRHGSQRLVRLGLPGRNSATKPNIPNPRTLSRRGSGNLKKPRDHKPPLIASSYVRGLGDGMSHVGYTELKITSDSESEFPFSDDDAFIPITDFNIERPNRSSHESLSGGSFRDKISKYKQCHFRDDKDKNTLAEASMSELIHPEDIKQQLVRGDENATIFSEFITPVDGSPSSSSSSPVKEDNAGTESHKENDARASKNPSASDRIISNTDSTVDTSATSCRSKYIDASYCENQNQKYDSAPFAQEVPDSAQNQEGYEKIEHVEAGSVAKEDSSNEKDGVNVDSEPVTPEDVSGSAVNDSVNGDAATKEHSSDEEDEIIKDSETLTSDNVSGSVAKEHTDEEVEDGFMEDRDALASKNLSGSVAKEHSIDGEDGYKGEYETLTPSNVSGSVAKEDLGNGEDAFTGDSETLTSDNASGSVPKEHSNNDEDGVKGDSKCFTPQSIPNEESSMNRGDKESLKVTEILSTSNETPVLKLSASVESFGSIDSDFESENLVDLLKQQVVYERKCLKDLQKELEEERNASAVAVNEAMAMITRLQEEKAALHMEALQYLRMMDEQAEHDVEALEKANDLLADKEKELQDLEMELEYYRFKYPDEPRDEIIAAMGIPAQEETHTTNENKDKTPTVTKVGDKHSFTNSSYLEIEAERSHISQRLKNLEKTLHKLGEGRLPKSAEHGSSKDIEVPTSNGSLETPVNRLEHEDNVSIVNEEPLGEENNLDDPNKESGSLPIEEIRRSRSPEKNE